MRSSLCTLFIIAALLTVGCSEKPQVTWQYEGVSYAFADEAARAKFQAEREKSLYHRLGGKAAIDAAVDRFYVKVLADKRINEFFQDINMKAQHRKQKEFLSAAFGGPIPWKGKDMRAAHERNDETLERIYIGRRFKNDTERLEKLFELYTKMTTNAPAKKAAGRRNSTLCD